MSHAEAPADRFRDLSSYPLRSSVVLRLSDSRGDGHVENSVLARLYDDARHVLHKAAFGADAFTEQRNNSLMLAESRTRYLGEVRFPATLTIGVGIVAVGTSSITEQLGLFDGERCLGLCTCVMVSTANRASSPLSDAERLALRRYAFA